MTDERHCDRLFDAIARLPRGAGIVFRHYSLPRKERRALWDEVRAAARGKSLTLVVAGPSLPGAHGSHNRPGRGLRTWSAHNLREIRAAERARAHLVFLSPVFATRSHPDAQILGARRFAVLAHQTRLPVIALGGVDEGKARTIGGAYGWAGIDAWG
jgi:thiamine-phosphate pyrophosphorylase